jgi:hypothetical protein
VTQLLADPRKAAELGQSARRQVQDHYSWEARLSPLDALLKMKTAGADALAKDVAPKKGPGSTLTKRTAA